MLDRRCMSAPSVAPDPTPAPTTVEVFHGTDQNNWSSIQRNNFQMPLNPKKEWLGAGVYFFSNGISNHPANDAKNWAITNPKLGIARYRAYVVIKAEVRTDYMLDLTDDSQLKFFNEIREEVYELFGDVRIKRISSSYDKDANEDSIKDVEIFEKIRESHTLHVVKCHLYFKFYRERTMGIGSRIPNVTVICVYNPSQAVIANSIKLHNQGIIS